MTKTRLFLCGVCLLMSSVFANADDVAELQAELSQTGGLASVFARIDEGIADPTAVKRTQEALQTLALVRLIVPNSLVIFTDGERGLWRQEQLLALVELSVDNEVAAVAAGVVVNEFGDSEQVELIVIDRLRKVDDIKIGNILLDALGAAGFTTLRVEEELVGFVREDPISETRVKAAILAAEQSTRPSDELLAFLVEVAASDSYFARPKLVESISRYGTEAREYLPELEKIRSRLVAEIAKPYDRRSVEIWNEQWYLSAIDETIAKVQSL